MRQLKKKFLKKANIFKPYVPHKENKKIKVLTQWNKKIKSPYNYQKKYIKNKSLPRWLARTITKTFIPSKISWKAYYDLSARSYRRWKQKKFKKKLKKKKKIYTLFGLTNYVYRAIGRAQFPRINKLRVKPNLNRLLHKKLILLQFRIPNDLYMLYKPWKYKVLPHTILRNHIKQKYNHFYKIVGNSKKYKLKFFKTLKGAVLKNSAITKLNYIWDKLLWYKANKSINTLFTKPWHFWLLNRWIYRTSTFYTQLFFYRKKK